MHRRRHLAGIGGSLSILFSGCVSSLEGTVPIEEIVFELDNRTTSLAVFHVAVETDAGVGGRHSKDVTRESTEELRVTPETTADSATVHSTVGEDSVSSSTIPVSTVDVDEDVVCPRIDLRYNGVELDAQQRLNDVRC